MTISPSTPLALEARVLAATGRRATLMGMWLNSLFAAAKITGGILGHSFALLADGIESLGDIFSSLVLYTGLKYAVKPRDENHPYGHGKAEPIAALAVGLGLVGAAISIGIQSIREITTPHSLPAPFTLFVLAGVLVAKESLFRRVIRVGKEIGSIAVQTDAWHHRSDAVTSGLAFVGITVSLLGGNGWESADDWAALVASFLMLLSASRQIGLALAELSDVAPPGTIQDQIRAVAGRVPGVVGLEKCLVRKMGLEFFVDLHVIVDGDLSVREGHRIGHSAKHAIVTVYPRIAEVLVHIEPARASLQKSVPSLVS